MTKRDDRWALYLGLAAILCKRIRPRRPRGSAPSPPLSSGISVVIPSREGRRLLERMLPGVEEDLGASGLEGEIIVVDNGSSDGTAQYLARSHPRVRVDEHREPLSFARAANRGAALARYRRLCLLNNDMEISAGFLAALDAAFREDPALFCASAQIFFPEGARREETGKTAMRRADRLTLDDYPVFCDVPLPGEDLSPVLYGSGGCSLYDRAKFWELGGFDEFYQPAYVEDLDLGYRAWLRGWPSIYTAGACVLHHHRATSSRFFQPEELDRLLEVNHARFLLRAVQSAEVFRAYYPHALARLRHVAPDGMAQVTSIGNVFTAALRERRSGPFREQEILDLTGGSVHFFPGRANGTGRKALLSADSVRPSDERLVKLASSAEIYYLAYVRPGAAPDRRLLELCRTVILVDGPAGDGPYRAALKEAQRRYSIEEMVFI